jgi:D-xylonolactonase
MTIDAEGCLWVALWDGGAILRFSPKGEAIMRVGLPAEKVTCPTFGGPDYRSLYVTTAGGDARSDAWPGAGALFRLSPAIGGVPEFRSRIGSR